MCAELLSVRYNFSKNFLQSCSDRKIPQKWTNQARLTVILFLPIQKIRLQVKVIRFWIEIACICWRTHRFSIRKPVEHQPSFSITVGVSLKYTDLKSTRFNVSSKIANFFLKTHFLDRQKIEWPSSEPDSFIFEVFYDRSNSPKSFSKSCTSPRRALHTSTNFQNALRDAAHIVQLVVATENGQF